MDRLSIGCDGRALVGPRTGVGTWTERVAGGLARSGAGRVDLAATRAVELTDDERHPNLITAPPPRLSLPGPLWLNTTVPRTIRRRGHDVWIGALAVVPLRSPAPTVAMVHDLTPLTHPDRHTAANRLVYRFLLGPSLRSATAVVAGTEATASEVLTRFPSVAPKLVRIGYGVDAWYSPPAPGDDGSGIRRRFSRGRPYILHLGTIEPRKGIVTLVAAWELLQQQIADTPDLVIAGRPGWRTGPIYDRIKASPAFARIHLAGYVARSDARELLRHAEAFVLASEAEGFGLPLAEAISCGTPAVASDIPVLREAAGDAAIYCRVGSAEDFAAGLRAAVTSVTAAELRRRALERAPKLRWGPVVERWAELLRRITTPRREA